MRAPVLCKLALWTSTFRYQFSKSLLGSCRSLAAFSTITGRLHHGCNAAPETLFLGCLCASGHFWHHWEGGSSTSSHELSAATDLPPCPTLIFILSTPPITHIYSRAALTNARERPRQRPEAVPMAGLSPST